MNRIFLKVPVLSRKMDSAEIRFVRKAFLEYRGGEVFRKNRPSPILWQPFKDSAPVGKIWILIPNGAYSSVRCAFYLLHTVVANDEKNNSGTCRL